MVALTAVGQENIPLQQNNPSAPSNDWGNPLPDEIGYQGQLIDSNGLPQVGSYTMEFTILSGAPDYTLLYTETQTVNTDAEGLFNVMIGAIQPGLDDALASGDAWLEVKLDGEILAPRQPVGSVAYALYAQHLVGGTGFRSVLVGGEDNDVSGNWSVSAGGLRNIVTGSIAFIGGGRDNVVNGWFSVVAGGDHNSANGANSTVAGGSYNVANSQHATVGGGNLNEANNLWAVVSGGQRNVADGRYTTIGGGLRNEASWRGATIGGGWDNTAPYTYTTISGGHDNIAAGYAATVGGGDSNSANNASATIGGGYNNTADGAWSTVGGGHDNTANWPNTTVGGGRNNTADLDGSTVGGGENNTAGGLNATVSGGYNNNASGIDTAIGGGVSNTASGFRATIPGGWFNTAAGDNSFAAGTEASAAHEGTFVWSDSSFSTQDFQSTADYQFLIDAEGGVGINTNTPQSQLHVVDTQNGTATSLSAHVASITNDTTGTSPDVLALQVSNTTNPNSGVNYITFFDGSGAIAAIEGNGSGGVVYKTSGADFAEYLPLNIEELGCFEQPGSCALAPGTVLGLADNGLQLDTAKAQRVLVVSTAAGFVGNADEANERDDMALVAFMGQVPVRVRGAVQAGDLLVASGLGDGTAVSLPQHQLTPALANQIVGQALASSHGDGIFLVNTLVGMPTDAFWAARLTDTETQLNDLEARLAALEALLLEQTEAGDE